MKITQELKGFIKLVDNETDNLQSGLIDELKKKKENILNKLKSFNGNTTLLDEYLKILDKDELLYTLIVITEPKSLASIENTELTSGFDLLDKNFVLSLRKYNEELKLVIQLRVDLYS